MKTPGGRRLSDNRPGRVIWLMLLVFVSATLVTLPACAVQDSMLAPGEEDATTEAAETPEPEPEPVTLTQQTNYLEYSNETTDPLKLIECSDTTVQITCDPEELQLNEVGEVVVTYHLVRGDQSSDVDLVFEVRDTKNPSIEFAQAEVTIEQGAAFDPAANISSVNDPVDGDLARVDAEPEAAAEEGQLFEQGWYLVGSEVDPATPGTYDVTVEACDIHGNRREATYRVTVNEPPAPEPEPEPAAPVPQTHHYVINTNTGVFHYADCRSVRQMADHNKREVDMTREEVIAMGYRPCGNCHP